VNKWGVLADAALFLRYLSRSSSEKGNEAMDYIWTPWPTSNMAQGLGWLESSRNGIFC